MSADWPCVQISDACDLIVDCVNKTAPRVGHATPYKMIRTPNIRNGRIDLTDCRFVERETFEKWTRRAKVERDDVLLTREAPMGEVGLVDFDDTVFLGQRVMQYRVNKSILLPRFLLYSFLSADLQNQFRMHDGTGSVVSHIRVPDCSKFELNLPPLAEQERITAILGSLDDKIQLNHQINQTLEQMAQAIFKSWFVDFEPVKAKIAAREQWLAMQPVADAASPVCYADQVEPLPDLNTWMNLAAMQAISGKTRDELVRLQSEQPEQYAELRATAELFPSAMVDAAQGSANAAGGRMPGAASELGEIPEGWTVGALADVANLNQQSWTKRTIPSEIRYVDLANTKNGVIESTTTYLADDAPSRARRILSEGDTIVGTVRPGNRSFAFIKRPQKTLTGSTGFAVLSPKQAELAEFVYITATSEEAINHLAHLADGGAYPAVRPEVVINLPCIVPTERLIAYFHKTVRSFFDQAAVKKLESSTLSVLRDTLLPKLLSGELSVSTTEDQLAEPANV